MSNILRKTAFRVALSVTIVFASALTTPTRAYAFYCSNCSTFYQQLYGYVEALNTDLNTAKSLQTEINQYNDMIKQGISLPSRMFNSIQGEIQKVTNVYNAARSLGRNVANIDSSFRQQFKGYESYLKSIGKASDMMPDRYKNWAQEGLDNARTAMNAVGINTSTFTGDDSILDQILQRSQTASGRKQAIQAGNEIAAQNVQQLQKLRDLVATQITLQANYVAQQQERQSVDDAFMQKFHSAKITNTGQNKGY